jgi:uncharacterized protein (DUF433 family)
MVGVCIALVIRDTESVVFISATNIDKALEARHSAHMNSRICIDPAVCHGKPVIRGSRVLVSTVLGALAGGDSVDAILADYPTISREDVAAALEFASNLSDYQVSAYEAVA